MASKKKILFIAEDLTLAHATRPLVLAQALDVKNFDILFVTGDRYQQYLCHTHFKTIHCKTLSTSAFIDRLAKGRPIFTKQKIEGHLREDIELLKKYKPDLVVSDFRLSMHTGCQLMKIPFIVLTNAFWSPYSKLSIPVPEHPVVNILGVRLSQFIMKIISPLILRYHCRDANKVRKKYDMAPYSNLKNMYSSGDWVLYLDPPSIVPTKKLPANHLYMGPIIWSPNAPLPRWTEVLPADRPVVYITLGSSGDIHSVETMIEVLATLPVSAVVSAAGRFTIEDPPKNIVIEPFLPGLEMAKRAALVVCSGGTAATYQALSCGTPIIGIPSNLDQYLSMEAICKQGASITIRAGQINTERFRQGLLTILNNPKFKRCAMRLKNEIRQYDSQKRFADFIDQLVLEGKI